MTPVEARFEIERQLCEIAAFSGSMPLIGEIRLAPSPDRRRLEVCVELLDGGELEVAYDAQYARKKFDEDAARQHFLSMPSMARH